MLVEQHCVGEMFWRSEAYDHLSLEDWRRDIGIVLTHTVVDFPYQQAEEYP